MKTFDMAINYLQKSQINFKCLDIYKADLEKNPNEAQKLAIAEIEEVLNKFLADSKNNKSNDYYRRMVFVTAMYHLCFKAQGAPSFWDESIKIIEQNRKPLDLPFEKYRGMDLPKIMVEKYFAWCQSLKPIPNVLKEDSEINLEMFWSAYEYVINSN